MSFNLGPRQLIDARIARVSSSQLALISRRQAVELGLSPASVHRRVRSGQWVRVFPNVYRFSNAPETEAQRQAAAALWAGPSAAVSHRTALQVWGMAVSCDFIEVVTTQRRDRLDGVLVHQLRTLPRSHLTKKDGIDVTTPERTLMDIAALEGSEVLIEGSQFLLKAISHFFRQKLVTFASIRRFLADASTRGLPGRRLLARALWHPRRVALGLPGAFAENVRLFMRREGIPEALDEDVTVQAPGSNFLVPLAYAGLKIAILEKGPNARWYERVLASQGWSSVSFYSKDLVCDPEYCALRISMALAAAGGMAPPPTRRFEVKRPWVDFRTKSRLRARVQAWRRNSWNWHLGDAVWEYDPTVRRDWENERALNWESY